MILELRRELDRIERSIAILEGLTRLALGHEPTKPWLVCVKGADHAPLPRKTKVVRMERIRNFSKES